MMESNPGGFMRKLRETCKCEDNLHPQDVMMQPLSTACVVPFGPFAFKAAR